MRFEPPDADGLDGEVPGEGGRGGSSGREAAEGWVPEYRRLGDYLLLGTIASGGMGVVYQAVHERLGRVCAIKLIRAGALASVAERNRFVREAEAAGVLDHPGVVGVRHAGEANGELFLEMELVEGCTLAERLAADRALGVRMAAREAALLVARLARAVQHAHDRGVLHRDLKPANVLLTESGAPRLTDFGLAGSLERGGDLTRTLAMLGTPAYMAPELAEGRSRGATSAADVYGLGAILYECLAGEPPYAGETPLAVLNAVRAGEPAPLLARRPDLPRDLEVIVQRAMRREESLRLPGAGALAEELERWLRGEPIQSRPVPWWRDFLGWTQRHPAATALALACGVALLAGLTATLWQWRRSERLADRLAMEWALSENRRAERIFDDGEAREAMAHLAAGLRRRPEDRWAAARLVSALMQRTWPRPVMELGPHEGQVLQVAWSSEGQEVYTADAGGWVRSWKVGTGAPDAAGVWRNDAGDCTWLGVSGDGRWLGSRSETGRVLIWPREGAKPALELGSPGDPVVPVGFLPVGSRLVVVRTRDPAVECWDPAGRTSLWRLSHPAPVVAVDWTRDGQRLMTADAGGELRGFDLGTGETVGKGIAVTGGVRGVRWHPDGRKMAVTRADGAGVEVWRWPEGERVDQQRHEGTTVAGFTPEGWLLRSVRAESESVATDMATGTERYRIPRVRDPVLGPAFSRNGRRGVMALDGQELQAFEAESGRLLGEPIRTRWTVESFALNPEGTRLVIAAGGETAVVWEVPEADGIGGGRTLAGHLLAVGFSQDGQRVWTCDRGGVLRGWALGSSAEARILRLDRSDLTRVAFSPGGRRVAVVEDRKELEVFEVDSAGSVAGPWTLPGEVTALQWTADDRGLAVGTLTEELVWIDLTDGRIAGRWDLRPEVTSTAYGSRVTHLDFSRDGLRLAASTYGGVVAVVEAGGKAPRVQVSHAAPVWRVQFSPEGGRFVTASGDGVVQVRDARTGESLAPAMLHDDFAFDAQFTADGDRVISVGADAQLRVWEAATGRALVQVRAMGTLHRAALVDGLGWMTAVGKAPRFRWWDVSTGLALSEWLPHPAEANRVVIAPTKDWVAAWWQGGPAQLYPIVRPPEGPVPRWLAEVAEATCGQRLGRQGEWVAVTPGERIALARRLVGVVEPQPFWASVLRRFMEGPR